MAIATTLSILSFCLSPPWPSRITSSNRVLAPPSKQDPTSWDRYSFAGPVVVPTTSPEEWRMYYYGRESEMWNLGVPAFSPFLPSGRIGMAKSRDGGLSFDRFKGPEVGGSLFGPSDESTDFDCLHVAVGDVVYEASKNRWLMYYFGGGMEEARIPGIEGGPKRGARFQVGLAVSSDGVNFRRQQREPIVEAGLEGEWDELGVAWPRVVIPDKVGGSEQWIMTYHTHEEEEGSLEKEKRWTSVGVALSSDGKKWQKKGMALTKGETGSWDEAGISTRHVIRYGDQYLMFYEGVNQAFEYCIGLAVSENGVDWRKDMECGDEPGGPLLRPLRGHADAWDNWVVGTPYVLPLPDHSLRMYYMGLHLDPNTGLPGPRGIGFASSLASDFRTWKRG